MSKDPKVSIVRKGFTLIPDYASTAFMMQGYSLEAAIAECGDEFQVGGLSEMMTTYVILSRVKKGRTVCRFCGHFPRTSSAWAWLQALTVS